MQENVNQGSEKQDPSVSAAAAENINEKTSGGPNKQLIRRRTPWEGTRDAMQYLAGIKKTRQFRKSDYTSALLLAGAILCSAILPCLPIGFGIISVPLDGLLVICLFYYLFVRLGVLTTLSEEKAWLIFEIILGAGVLGFCLAAAVYGMCSVVYNAMILGLPH